MRFVLKLLKEQNAAIWEECSAQLERELAYKW